MYVLPADNKAEIKKIFSTICFQRNYNDGSVCIAMYSCFHSQLYVMQSQFANIKLFAIIFITSLFFKLKSKYLRPLGIKIKE